MIKKFWKSNEIRKFMILFNSILDTITSIILWVFLSLIIEIILLF